MNDTRPHPSKTILLNSDKAKLYNIEWGPIKRSKHDCFMKHITICE